MGGEREKTQRAQYSLNSSTDAPALVITPFITPSNNVTGITPFGGRHGWEEGMPRPRQPNTRYPEWQRPAKPLPPTFRTEAHTPHFPPNRYPPEPARRYTPVPSPSDLSHNGTLSPQTSRTPYTPNILSAPPLSAVSATSTTPLTQGGPITPMLDWEHRSLRGPDPVVEASPATAKSSSLRRLVSAGLRETSQRPFSEISISLPYVVGPLSPDARSPALVASSPIDAAYPVQTSAPSALEVGKTPRTLPEHDTRLPRSSGLQPPGPVVEPSSPSFGTRRPSQPALTPPSTADVPHSGPSPTTPRSRMRVAEARDQQERARRQREEVKRQEKMRFATTGMPATFRKIKGLEARDARSKTTDNMRDLIGMLDENRIDTTNHKGNWGNKKNLKRPKGMNIDTRMGGDSSKGKKSPVLLSTGVSTPKTSASSRPPPTAGIPMDIEPGSPPERGLLGHGSMDDRGMGAIARTSTTESRTVDRKGIDEDRVLSRPLDAPQSRSSRLGSELSSPLTSPEEKGSSTTGRPSLMSARSGVREEPSRVDVPSSLPINSPLAPNSLSAGLATPSWLQSTFMSVPPTPPSAGVPPPTPGAPIPGRLSIRSLNVRRAPVPLEPPERLSAPGSASFAPIMEAQDPRFSIVDPRQAAGAAGTDHRRGGIDVSRRSAPRKPPTPVQTSARTVQAGESGWF